MKKYISLFIVLGIMLMMLPVMTSTCFACSCAFQPDPVKALERADVVFSGKVLDIKVDVWEDRKKGEVYDWRNAVRFEVNQVWKGTEKSELIVFTSYGGGPSCGFEFKVGESYLVYSYKSDRTGVEELHTNTCSRTTLLSSAANDLERLGESQRPNEQVNLSGKMTEFKVKNVIYHSRKIYHGLMKLNLLYIVPVTLVILIGGMYLIVKWKRTRDKS